MKLLLRASCSLALSLPRIGETKEVIQHEDTDHANAGSMKSVQMHITSDRKPQLGEKADTEPVNDSSRGGLSTETVQVETIETINSYEGL